MRRIDLEQAGCADPDCEADHGYTGSMAGDDLTVRMSAADRRGRPGRPAGAVRDHVAARHRPVIVPAYGSATIADLLPSSART